jgi:starch synthase
LTRATRRRDSVKVGSIRGAADAACDTESRKECVVVANPGAVAEMPQMAAGLAAAGLLRAYVAPFGSKAEFSLLPAYVRRRIEPQLERRRVPSVISDDLVKNAATALELLVVGSQRLKLSARTQSRLISLRNADFDKRVAEMLREDDRVFIGCYTSAERSLRACHRHGTISFLEYPIAHHAFAERVLQQEAALQPEYASTLQAHRFPSDLRNKLDREVALADRIFVLSTFQKATFVESGVDESKLVVTPLGVDIELFRPMRALMADRPFRILFVGQITQRKGVSYLVEAFRQAAIPESELVLVGRICGDPRPWSKVNGVRWVPHVPRSELPRLYATASAFVLPSIVEGFALTALEAMACGIPPIVSTNTFATDVITDGRDGFVVPIRDANAITERLLYLHGHPSERRRIGEAASARAQQFSWDAYGQRVVGALAPVLA